jgi:hypothetical protein
MNHFFIPQFNKKINILKNVSNIQNNPNRIEAGPLIGFNNENKNNNNKKTNCRDLLKQREHIKQKLNLCDCDDLMKQVVEILLKCPLLIKTLNCIELQRLQKYIKKYC